MRIHDYLSTFSVEDLRLLASRRQVPLSPQALRSRQTLVSVLAAAVSRYESMAAVVPRLTLGEMVVLKAVLSAKSTPGLSALAVRAGAEPGLVRHHLESLRLTALLFPEGDWEHIVFPGILKQALYYLPPGLPDVDESVLRAPVLEPAPPVVVEARPGSLERDLAEAMARVARSRMRITQAGSVNRRDMKSVEPSLSIQFRGYSVFLFGLLVELGLIQADPEDGVLFVPERGEQWLALPPPARNVALVEAWVELEDYPETSPADPVDGDYLPYHLESQRQNTVSVLLLTLPGALVSVAGTAALLAWLCPAGFESRQVPQGVEPATSCLVRSLYWLGLVEVDDPARPRAFRPTVRAAALNQPETAAELLVPEERAFVLQPNAEAFAPPNLAPRIHFHLRRLTAEKKNSPTGVFPVTPESIRRALDSGIRADAAAAYLERFSRTGLPPSVRSMVESVARQHGRIRIVPADYVVITDDAALMRELLAAPPIADLLETQLTERSAAVSDDEVATLLKRVRARGYSPLDLTEPGHPLPLPDGADEAPLAAPPAEELLDWSALDGQPGGAPEPESDVRAIRDLLITAIRRQESVELEYYTLARPGAILTFRPNQMDGRTVAGFYPNGDYNVLELSRITWARPIGPGSPS